MRTIQFTIQGTPVAKARSRQGRYGHYTPKKTSDYESLVKHSYQSKHGDTILDGAIEIDIAFNFSPPKSWSKKKQREAIGKPKLTKPDTDNLIKTILDGLNGVAYKDDNIVYSISAKRMYAEDERTDVTLCGGIV